jgi:hypothetical protein
MAAAKKSAKKSAKKTTTKKGSTTSGALVTLAGKVEQIPDLSEAAYLLADEFAGYWDVRPGRDEHSTVLRDAWEAIWERGGKVKRTIRLLDQAADGARYDMDEDFVAIRVTPKHLVQVGKRLCTSYVNMVTAQRRYWRVRPKLSRRLALGFSTTTGAPASTSAALRKWRDQRNKRHAELDAAYRKHYVEVLDQLVQAAETLDDHIGGLQALFARMRAAEEARLSELIRELPRGDPRRPALRQGERDLRIAGRRLLHFRKAPAQLFPTWKQGWILPRQRMLARLAEAPR